MYNISLSINVFFILWYLFILIQLAMAAPISRHFIFPSLAIFPYFFFFFSSSFFLLRFFPVIFLTPQTVVGCDLGFGTASDTKKTLSKGREIEWDVALSVQPNCQMTYRFLFQHSWNKVSFSFYFQYIFFVW